MCSSRCHNTQVINPIGISSVNALTTCSCQRAQLVSKGWVLTFGVMELTDSWCHLEFWTEVNKSLYFVGKIASTKNVNTQF